MTTQTFTVTGMTCEHCARSVTEELSGLTGVTDVRVALDSGRVTVIADQALSKDAVTAAISEAGYALAAWPDAG